MTDIPPDGLAASDLSTAWYAVDATTPGEYRLIVIVHPDDPTRTRAVATGTREYIMRLLDERLTRLDDLRTRYDQHPEPE